MAPHQSSDNSLNFESFVTRAQELTPLVIAEADARADGSTGWCLMVGNIELGTGGAYLPDRGIERVLAQGPDIVIAGHGIPRGVARPAEGG